MKITIYPDAETVASAAAAMIAAMAREDVAARGRFVMAVSGGRTPWQMLRALGREEMPWEGVYMAQVDERIAPAGDADRNLVHLRESLLECASLRPEQIYAMPVEDDDLRAAAGKYARMLQQIAGTPPVFDLIHLGMGADGHTASLLPADPTLDVMDADVALTGLYQQRRRMTLTYPVINRARRVLWVITGGEKAAMFERLLKGDASIPAGRVNQARAIVLADAAARCEFGDGDL